MPEAQELTILLVEDDPGHARLIEKNLRRANIQNTILHFTDGQQILTYFFGEQDVVDTQKVSQSMLLLDLGLPIIDGYQVLKNLKQDSRTERIPVIMLTTLDDAVRLNDCYQLGCKVCITKPVQYQDLAEAIRTLGLFLSVSTFPDGV